jgi:hypothetical protein
MIMNPFGRIQTHPQSTYIYKEYHSVRPLVGIGTLPPPLSPASVTLPPELEGAHSPAGEGLGESQFRRLEKSLVLCLLCETHHSFESSKRCRRQDLSYLGLRVLAAEHALYTGNAGLEQVLERLLGVPRALAPLGVLRSLHRQPHHHVVQRAEHRPVVCCWSRKPT